MNRRIVILGLLAILIAVAMPWAFYDWGHARHSGFVISMLSQMGMMVIFALSYNMLMGQAGLLSLCHATFFGFGAYCTVHLLDAVANGSMPVPMELVPFVSGLSGLALAIVFGYMATKQRATAFAMITLGIGELVYNCSLMFPDFFGGEGGITTNRVVGQPFLGISFGPAIQVYYLIAVWTLISMALMYAWAHTPLGRIANAVRDNPERAEFVGYDTQKVRWLTLIISAFFAGVAGALACITFEIVTAENVGAIRSAGVLIAAFIGGGGFFFGPIVGACLFVYFFAALSDHTKAWLLYLGLFFMAMVMFAPGGIASLLMMQLPVIARKRFKELVPHYARTGAAALLLLAALVLTVEMTYKVSVDSANGTAMKLFGVEFDAAGLEPWALAIGLWIVGGGLFRAAWKRLSQAWGEIQADIAESRA